MSLEQIRAFLEASQAVEFAGQNREETYQWIEATLRAHGYERLGRADKGLVRRYVAKMTGLSRAQMTRLIGGYLDRGEVKLRPYQRHRFPARYTDADIRLLAYVDRMHSTLSGPATKRILEREYYVYGQTAYERLAGIWVAQIYRFRQRADELDPPPNKQIRKEPSPICPCLASGSFFDENVLQAGSRRYSLTACTCGRLFAATALAPSGPLSPAGCARWVRRRRAFDR